MSLINTNVTVLEVNQNTINKPFEVGYKGDHNAYKLVFSDLVGDGYSVLFWKPMSKHCIAFPLVNNEWLLGNEVLSTSGTLYCQVVKKDESNNFIKHSQVFMLSVNESAPCAQQAFEEVPPNFKIAYDEMVAIIKKVNEALTSGKFNGLSAYELAVKNGFKGTEEEWIESLKYWNSPEFTKLAEQVRTDKEHVDTVVAKFDTKANQANTDFDAKVNTANTEFDKKVVNANSAFDKKVTDADTNFTNKVNKANTDLDTKVTQINSDLNAKETAINQALDTKIDGANSVIDAKVQESATSAENAKQSELKAQSIADNMQGLTNAFRIDTSEQGRVITATDSADSAINGLKVFGESTQVQSTGAQCISAPNHVSKTMNGITFEVISPSKIRVFGTATDMVDIAGNFFTLNEGEYTLSINTTMDINKFRVCLIGNGGAPFLNVPNKQTFKTETINEMDYCLSLRVYKGVTIDFTFEVMLAKGNKALPYEPYTNGMATPTSANPSEIVSKTISEINVLGKNLFDVSKIKTNFEETKGGIINNGDGSLFIKSTVNDSTISTNLTLQELCPALKVGDTVVLNYINKNYANDCRMYLYEAKFVFNGKKPVVIKDNYLTSKVKFYSSSSSSSSVNTSTTLSDIQIEYGSTPTAYLPYKEPQTVTLSSPVTLYGCGVRNNNNNNNIESNVTINGRNLISDVITEKDGVYGVERNCYMVVSDTNKVGIYNSKKGFYIEKILKDNKNRADGLCNIAKVGFGSGEGQDSIWIGVNNNSVYLLNSKFWDDSLEDKGLNNFIEFLKTNPLKLVTFYNESIFEPLPEADQQALKALKSNYPTTVVINNDNAFMQLDYVADTKNYIDNRLAEIKTAIIASKGV